MRSEAEIRQALRDWVVRTSGKIPLADLTDQTPLLERRLISSVHLMSLILLVEKLRGSRFDLKAIRPGAFSTIDAIYENFLVETELRSVTGKTEAPADA